MSLQLQFDFISFLKAENPTAFDAARQIRFTVFVEEQAVPEELEWDEDDETALHWLANDPHTGDAVGTGRILYKPDQQAYIGRMALLAAYRGQGVGKQLMLAMI